LETLSGFGSGSALDPPLGSGSAIESLGSKNWNCRYCTQCPQYCWVNIYRYDCTKKFKYR
jgi:hypothetical protein